MAPQMLDATDPARPRPFCGDARGEDDRATFANVRTGVFRRGEGAPIAEREEVTGGLEVRLSQRCELQGIGCREHEMVDGAQPLEQRFDRALFREIGNIPFGAIRQRRQGRVQPLLAARRDDDVRTLLGCRLCRRQPNPRAAAQDYDALSF